MSLADHPAQRPVSGSEWMALVVLTLACLIAGSLGGFVTAASVNTWYPGLSKPPWNPPDAVFAPVWTTLFVMMAVSVWMVWRRRGQHDTRLAMVLFASQLLLNVGWSSIFFGLQRPDLAMIEILVLWLCIAATIGAFARISRSAAALLVPYLAWVSFASALNFAIWRLNP